MTTCTSCGASGQPASARFCFSCGTNLQVAHCDNCQSELVPDARFCSSCGAVQGVAQAAPPQRPVASRRVTSVLFGDLVGFTSLSESRDQEEVRELLTSYFEECRQIIARYGGTVEKFIGDAVMAVWGVPTTHEDDAERAVRAGLELVNRIAAMGSDLAVPDLSMRVGIVTGEVAVTIGAEQQGMVAGDAVNTAARVQSAAVPGQVWVDETTRLLTTSAISYVDVGSHVMKGKADPVPLWSVRAVVAGIGGVQRADGLEAPHVGRDRELRLVKEIFHGVEETGRPALMVVDGEPGVGKTRLGWEFEKYTDGLRTTVRWHSGRCLSYGEGVAFYALAEAIRGRLQSLRPDGEGVGDADEDQAELLALGMDTYVPDPDERTWLEPRLGALLGIGAVGTFKREDLFTAWTTFFHRIGSDEHSVVLVIDDAQHADDGMVTFLEHLMAVASFPVFVLLLARQALLEEHPGLATNRRVTVLHLEALTAPDMGLLLDGLVVGLPESVRTPLVERAEGIPLFAVETVRSLIDRDLVLPKGGQYVLSDPDTLDLDAIAAPASLQALIAARLDTLPKDERRIIDSASVVGNSFTRNVIEALCPDVTDLEAALAGLVRLQLLRQETDRLSAELGHYQFVQSGVRQVAYGTLSRRDRKASHLAVVRLLEDGDNSAGELSPIIAQHLLEALDAVPDGSDIDELAAAAVGHLRRAAERASALGAPAESAGHLQVALSRSADPALTAAIESELAQQLQRAGDHDGAVEHATRACDLFEDLGEPVEAGRAVATLCLGLIWGRGEFDRAQGLATERLAMLTGREDAAEVELLLTRARVSALLRTGADLREAAEQHARLADRVGDESDVADSYVSLALHYLVSGPHGLGRVLLESAAAMARTAHDTRLLSRALTNLNADWTQDDAERAVSLGREAVEAGHAMGDRSWVSSASANLLMGLYLTGRWDEALERIDADVLDDIDSLFGVVIRGQIAVARGEDWAPELSDVSRLGEEDLALLAFRKVTMARLAQLSGESDVRDLVVESAELMYRQAGIFDDFTMLWRCATEVAWDAGDRAALDGLFGVLAEDRYNKRPTGLRAQQQRMLGLIAIQDGADPATVESHLGTAIAECRTWNSPITLAVCQADLGAWLSGQGRPDEAAPLLAEARATFDRLGAAAWAERLEAALTRVDA